jgi:hypothetical protein
MVLGIESRALCLLSKYSTPGAMAYPFNGISGFYDPVLRNILFKLPRLVCIFLIKL